MMMEKKRSFLSVCLLLVAIVSANAQHFAGAWTGKLSVQGTTLSLVFHFKADEKGKFSALMDSPDQGIKGIPATLNSLKADSVDVVVPAIGAQYIGKWVDGKIEGRFMQLGQTYPLALTSGEEQVSRPQTPRPKYPYRIQEVTFQNPEAQAVLSGTLTYPIRYEHMDKRKVPVVLMVTGSGPQNRDEEIFDHKPFLVLADYLARHGIASLRYDDRGTAKSTGDASRSTMRDNAGDASCGLAYLRGLHLFGKVGVMGHSEGGCIALMLASEGKTDFIVSLAGVGVRGDSLMVKQLENNLAALYPDSSVRHCCTAFGKILQLLRTTPKGTNKEQEINAILEEPSLSLSGDMKTMLWKLLDTMNVWLFDFMNTDMGEFLPQITCPVMAVNGSKDVQVDAKTNLDALRKGLKPNKKNLIREYEGLNHLFQHCTTGQATEYRSIEETFSEDVMRDIVEWINHL